MHPDEGCWQSRCVGSLYAFRARLRRDGGNPNTKGISVAKQIPLPPAQGPMPPLCSPPPCRHALRPPVTFAQTTLSFLSILLSLRSSSSPSRHSFISVDDIHARRRTAGEAATRCRPRAAVPAVKRHQQPRAERRCPGVWLKVGHHFVPESSCPLCSL